VNVLVLNSLRVCLSVCDVAASLDRGRREFEQKQHRCLTDVRQLRHRLASSRKHTTAATTKTTTTTTTTTKPFSSSVATVVS